MASRVLARNCRLSFYFHSSFSAQKHRFYSSPISTRSTGLFHRRLSVRYVSPSPSSSSSSSSSEVSSHGKNPKVIKVSGPQISFCPACGAPTEQRIPAGEEKLRAVCTLCGRIHYQNPKMVVGCLVTHEDKVLLCKRSIEPSYGLWTLPAGYMEIGESAIEGAIRETWEEAKAEVHVEAPFAQLDIPRIGQSYILFRAKLKKPHFSPGIETLECALFNIHEIPFDQLAFSSIQVALKLYVEDFKVGTFKVHHGVIDKRGKEAIVNHINFFNALHELHARENGQTVAYSQIIVAKRVGHCKATISNY